MAARRPIGLFRIEQPDPRHLHPDRLGGEGLPLSRPGFFPHRAFDVAQIFAVARPQLAPFGPLLTPLGGAPLLFRAPRFASHIGVTHFRNGFVRCNALARGRRLGCRNGLRRGRR